MNSLILKMICLSVALCLLMLPAEALAATSTWNSTTSTNWFTAGNWTGGVPTSTSTAVINLGSSGPIVNATGAVANSVEVGTTATGGTLGVTTGGGLSDTNGYLGYNSGASGTATVSGSGASWANSTNLYVGNNGSGILNVQNGGGVSDATGAIGQAAGSTGTATVSGSGASWANSTALTVGTNGNGTLNVQSGGAVSDANGNIGLNTGSTGTATVTGSGSSWVSSGNLEVGKSGTGTLNVESSGAASDATGYLGFNAGSTGTATVTGSGSSWSNTGNLYVGNSGTGTLNVQSGATVSDVSSNIGSATGSTGSATVTGSGSSWSNSGTLNVGSSGSGTLEVDSGGAVTDASGRIGNAAGSMGTATVTGAGSSWTSSGNLYAGYNGNGTLTIENGSAVSNTNGYIGFNAGSTGAATVTGAGSSWTSSNTLFVGTYAGSSGTLNILDGGTVNDTNGLIANSAGPTGSATVSGSGSTWANSGNIAVGDGTLTLESGGTITDVDANIGNTAGTNGSATVTGSGASWTSSGAFNVGNNGNGTLTVSSGATISDQMGRIGANPGTTGTATVSGSGSQWANSADLYVGNQGAGTLTIADCAEVTANSGVAYSNNGVNLVSTGTVYIADTPGSVGTLNIGAPAGQAPAAPGTLAANTVAFGQGTGTLVFNHTSQNYVFAPAITGNGTIDVLSGKTILSGSLNDFSGSIYMAPDSGAALTTTDSLQASTEKLGSSMRAMAIESRSTANALLGLTRPVDDRNYLFYGAMFGSAVVYGGGQLSKDGVTFLGGFAEGTQDYPGIRASSAPTVAAALRYTFDDPFGDKADALHPYGEIGGWAAPSTDLALSRTYLNGDGLSMGQGDTNARSWAEYGRGGLVWNATNDDQFTGYGELGQQYMSFNGYAETTGAGNPFPATVGGGLFRMDVGRVGASWTRNLKDLIYAPWSITLAGDAARSFDVHSGLTAAVDGVGGMTASNESDTWGEFGARLETHITEQASFYVDLSGTTGGGGIGTVLHAGAGLTYSF